MSLYYILILIGKRVAVSLASDTIYSCFIVRQFVKQFLNHTLCHRSKNIYLVPLNLNCRLFHLIYQWRVFSKGDKSKVVLVIDDDSIVA